MNKVLFALFFFGFFQISPISAQTNWTPIEQAQTLAKQQNKKIMVKIYTNWCGWCKYMDTQTFNNNYVSSYLNSHYVCVRFNAETRDKITFNGKTYGRSGSCHDLAAMWMGNQFSYPTTVFLDENGNLIQAITGFQKPNEFERIMTYFASNSHFSTPWQNYVQTYQRPTK